MPTFLRLVVGTWGLQHGQTIPALLQMSCDQIQVFKLQGPFKNAALEMGLMIEVTLTCLGTFRFQAVQMDWEVFPRSVGPTLLVNYG